MKHFAYFRALLAAVVLACLYGASASAQRNGPPVARGVAVVRCGQSIRYNPGLQGYYDLTNFPTSADPAVATGVGGRIGGGTAGEIEITGVAAGTTVITYGLKDFSGNPVVVRVIVVVFCHDIPNDPPPPKRDPHVPPPTERTPPPPPDKPIPVPRLPVPPATPTHRVSCAACMSIANRLNAVSDQLAAAEGQLVKDEGALLASFRAFSRANYDRSMADFNAKQKAVDDDWALIQKLQADLAKLVKELDDCEKLCNAGSSLGIPPAQAPQDGRSRPADPPKNAGPQKSSSTPSAPPREGSGSMKSMTFGIVLPDDLPPGQTVTGSVVANQEDYKNIPGIQVIDTGIATTATASLEGTVVDTGNGEKQTGNNFRVLVPIGMAATGILISTLDHPDEPSAVSVPVNTASRPVPKLPTEYTTPGASVNRVVEIHGPIPGDSTLTTATVDGQPAHIVASAPGKVFVDMSHATAAGLHHVKLFPRGQEAVSLDTRVIHTTATVGQPVLKRGQSTEMTLIVDAGQLPANETGSVSVSLVNQSPGVIRIAGKQELTFSSKELSKGPVTAKVKVVATGTGPFVVGWITKPSFKESSGIRAAALPLG